MVDAENNPTRYTFDGLSRMSKRERALTTGATIEDFTKSQDTIWAFDRNSRMTSFKDDGPNETTWDFDALDRTTRQTFPDTKTVLFEHDLASNVTKTTDPSGNVTNDAFDDLNRNTIRAITLATGFVGTTSETRAYDELDRMVTNEDNDYKLQYEYAVIGLRSYVAKETQSYVSGYTLSKTVTKTYDAVGNRITEACPSGSNLSLADTYDAEGRRVEKSVMAGKFERYIRSRGREQEGSSRLRNNPGLGARYDMSQVVATFDSNGAWKQNFVWGERIDEIAVLEQADVLDYDDDANTAEITRSYYHLNALGSVMEITDANQAKVVSYRYTPYGEMTITRGGVTQGADPLGQYWGYTARFSDEETELWYYRARYYDGATGRFLQRDPAGYAGGPGLYEFLSSALRASSSTAATTLDGGSHTEGPGGGGASRPWASLSGGGLSSEILGEAAGIGNGAVGGGSIGSMSSPWAAPLPWFAMLPPWWLMPDAFNPQRMRERRAKARLIQDLIRKLKHRMWRNRKSLPPGLGGPTPIPPSVPVHIIAIAPRGGGGPPPQFSRAVWRTLDIVRAARAAIKKGEEMLRRPNEPSDNEVADLGADVVDLRRRDARNDG